MPTKPHARPLLGELAGDAAPLTRREPNTPPPVNPDILPFFKPNVKLCILLFSWPCAYDTVPPEKALSIKKSQVSPFTA
jgi:hypothetical protein